MTKTSSIFGSSSTLQLGPFEHQLLPEIWSHGNATVRELLADGKIRQAYTTVMTTMDRLKKGPARPRRRGPGVPLHAAHTRRRIATGCGAREHTAIAGIGRTVRLPLSYLVEALSAHDAQLLDELQLLVERKRRELKAARPREKKANAKGQR